VKGVELEHFINSKPRGYLRHVEGYFKEHSDRIKHKSFHTTKIKTVKGE
tara:strand:+ start:79723 stop:79869 length:147 start_codon:yes stop_codon:yes gene_type:complete